MHTVRNYKNYDDLIGKQFNQLTVLTWINVPRKRKKKGLIKETNEIYCDCLCTCGVKIRCVKSNITTGHTKSCGCFTIEKGYSKEEIDKLKADGNYREVIFVKPALNSLYNKYQRKAKKRGKDFNLTKDEFKTLISANCVYCGGEPSTAYSSFFYNGIDRVDNSKGYILDNCATCCGTCNFMKGKKSKTEWFDQMIKICNHNHLRCINATS